MKMLILYLSFFLILPSCFSGSTLETFKIDLDLPPEERWKEVILSKKEFILNYTKMVLEKLEYPRLSLFLSNFYGLNFFNNTEFAREIRGIARYSNQTFAEVFLMNYMYESFAACTSIVYENENGELVLGHNLDYYFAVPMGHSIVLLEFYKNKKLLYKAQSVAGQIGIFTGLKPNAYAVTLNQRETGDIVTHWKQLFLNRVFPVIYNIRMGFEQAADYSEVMNHLSTASLGSPCYFILCGVKHNEGAIITRNPTNVSMITKLNADNDQDWFLVQTNSDRDLKDYEHRDIRRYAAEGKVKVFGRGIKENQMMENILSVFPNKNSITLLSSYVWPQKNQFNTIMWY